MTSNSSVGYVFINDVTNIEKDILYSVIFIYLIFSVILNFIYLSFHIFDKEIREFSEFFSLSMSTNYFLGSTFCLIFVTLIYLNIISPLDLSFCMIGNLGSSYLSINSQLSILGIFSNRYLLIRFPFKYERFCSNKCSFFFVILCNFFSVFISSISLWIKSNKKSLCLGKLTLNSVTVNIIVFFSLAPFLPSLIFYILILKIAKQHTTSIENQVNSKKSISKMAKFTFVNLLSSFVLWIIYGLILKETYRDLTKFSWKLALLLQIVLYKNIFLSSLIILITNSKINYKFLKLRIFKFFHKKIHMDSTEN